MHHIKVIKDGNVNNVVKEQLVDGVQYVDNEPHEGSLNGITSDAVAKVAEHVTTAEGEIGSIEEKIPSGASSSNKLVTESGMEDALSTIGTGYTPKGNATVATLEALTGQSNGDMYIVTDSGTLNDGALAVSAGDSVAWDSDNEVWYKTNQYATQQEHDALTTYAQNVAASIAPPFDPARTSENPYKAGESVTYTNGKSYVFKVDHYGPWAAADVELEPVSSIINRRVNNGVFDKVAQTVVLEYGEYVYGKKSENAARMRLSSPLIAPFFVLAKDGYLVSEVQKLSSDGIYISSDNVGTKSYSKNDADGYLYLVIFRKSDSSNFSSDEDPVDTLEYFGGQDVAMLIKYQRGLVERLNGVVSVESGSYTNGKKSVNAARMRLSVPLIAPFGITCKSGYIVHSVSTLSNDGTYESYVTVGNASFEKTEGYGKKYLVIFRKTDSTNFTEGENPIETLTYEGFGTVVNKLDALDSSYLGVIERLNGVVVAEAGGYSNGKKVANAARMRLNVPLIPPFKVFAKTGYIIHSVHITDNNGNYESYVSPGSAEYSQTTTSGKKYLVIFRKTDSTNFTEGENPLDHIDYEYGTNEQERVPKSQTSSCNVFARVGVIGDSYAAGYIKIDSSNRVIASDYSWPAFMARRTGRTWTNFAKSGSSCKSWVVNDNPTFSNIDAVQAEVNKCQAYVIGLQINDKSSDNPYYTPAGVLSDIGTTNDTYCAYLYRLISTVHSVNTDAKIFVCTLPSSSESDGYNAIVRGVVDYCKQTNEWNVYCIDLYRYKEYFNKNTAFVNDASYGHYTAVGYEFMSEMLFALISKIIDENESEFKNVYRIDYDSNS